MPDTVSRGPSSGTSLPEVSATFATIMAFNPFVNKFGVYLDFMCTCQGCRLHFSWCCWPQMPLSIVISGFLATFASVRYQPAGPSFIIILYAFSAAVLHSQWCEWGRGWKWVQTMHICRDFQGCFNFFLFLFKARVALRCSHWIFYWFTQFSVDI